jgi:hypothetical protein
VSPLEELADQLEDHGWDSGLIDAVKARMAQGTPYPDTKE